MTYKILKGDSIDELEMEVVEYMAKGWQPCGGIHERDAYDIVMQPMVLRENSTPTEAAKLQALEIAHRYGGIDGDHHKTWVIDQMVRALCGSQEKYEAWVIVQKDGEDGPNSYDWDEGIAP